MMMIRITKTEEKIWYEFVDSVGEAEDNIKTYAREPSKVVNFTKFEYIEEK